MPSWTYPCLYCGNVERPRTEEHVLQQAFGTSWVLEEDVCGDCNTKVFSPLDSKLVEFARRFGLWDHPDLPVKRTMIDGQLGVTFEKETGLWQSVRLTRKIEPILLPQFILHYDGKCVFVADKGTYDARLLPTIIEEIRQPETLTLTTQIVADKTPRMNTAIVRSAPHTYVVRASDHGRAAAMQQLVETGQFGDSLVGYGEPSQSKSFQPWVEMQLSVPFGDIERAVAKTAVNFICKVLGPDVARGPGLKGLREFATQPYNVKEAGYVSITILDERDTAFADTCRQFASVGHHTLLLMPVGRGSHIVVLILYQRPFAVVRLSRHPREPPFPRTDTMAAALFDYNTKTHHLYQTPDDLEWFFKRMPPPRR